MPICHIYVLAHIVLGESILSQMTQQSVRQSHYLRSAQMYKAISTLLADHRATFGQKLWTLIQVAMVEGTAQRNDLQQLHIKALDELVEANGGLPAYTELAADNVFLQASSQFYAGQLARSAILPVTKQRFEAVKTRFMTSLAKLEVWMCSIQSQRDSHHRGAAENKCSQIPRQLLSYLTHLVKEDNGKKMTLGRLKTDSGALFCCLSICLTFVECFPTIDGIQAFLLRVEQSMYDTATVQLQDGYMLDNLHPAAAAYSISCVRSEIFPDQSRSREFRISQALVDAHKMFLLLSSGRKAEVLMWLTDCISTVSMLSSHGAAMRCEQTNFTSVKLANLEREIEESWYSRKEAERQQRL